MRIISDRKDYYDCVQANDQDRETLFIREEKSERHPRRSWPFPYIERYGSIDNINYSVIVVGFCGKVYGALHFDCYRWDKPSNNAICWGIAQVDDFLNANLNKKALEQYNTPCKFNKASHWRGILVSREWRRDNILAFFNEFQTKQNDFSAMFTGPRPIFVATYSPNREEYDIVFNAQLKPVQFFRIFGPQYAYQELTQWVYNQAVPQKPIPQLDDETLAESKGFNRKTSFRKDPIRKRK
jgi:hypothetical protein